MQRAWSAQTDCAAGGSGAAHSRDAIPSDLYLTSHLPLDCLRPFLVRFEAANLTLHLTDDEQNRKFLEKAFDASVSAAYFRLKGAHRADLYRYAVLYARGGMYADIDTLPQVPMTELFRVTADTAGPTLFAVVSAGDTQIAGANSRPLVAHVVHAQNE
eukprot:2253787-Prymnesium_polylepis.4